MVSFRYFMLVLLTIGCRELVAEQSGFHNPYAVPLLVVLLLFVSLFVKIAALKAVHGATLSGVRFDWLARELFYASRLQVERWWCYGSPIVLLLIGWIKGTCTLEKSGWPQSLTLVFCFAPTLLFLLIVEMIASQVDRVGRNKLNSSMLRTWLTRIRLGEVGGVLTCLAPVVLLASISDLSRLFAASLGVDPSLVSSACTALIIVLFVLLFPAALTAWSAGTRLSDPLGSRVQQLVSQAKIRGLQAVLIGSSGRWAGAALVGWIPGFRRLWLGDGLVELLSAKELDMVVLHELSHVTRYHFLWRLMPVVWAAASGMSVWLIGDCLTLGDTLPFKLLAGLVSAGVMVVGLGYLAKRCEFDADWTACELAMITTDWADRQSPAEVLSSALSKLLEGNSAAEVSWLHPSLAQRLASLTQWNTSPKDSVLTTA